MQINPLSTFFFFNEIHVSGTQIARVDIKGDTKFPYKGQFIGSYFCLNVECDLQGCLCHLRLRSVLEEALHGTRLVSSQD